MATCASVNVCNYRRRLAAITAVTAMSSAGQQPKNYDLSQANIEDIRVTRRF